MQPRRLELIEKRVAWRDCGYLRSHALEVIDDDSVDAARER